MLKKLIIVVGNQNYGDPLKGFGEISPNVKLINSFPEDISLVMFTGGEDVHPSFYNGIDKGVSFTNIERDIYEKKIFDLCMQHNIRCSGICRGSQFLNVMCGGFMHQHINNHGVFRHPAYSSYNNETFMVSSTHHQLVGLPDDAIPISWAVPKRSDVYIGPNCKKVDPPEYEIEAAIYPKFNTMGVQYHPEIMNNDEPGKVHYKSMMWDFIRLDILNFTEKYGYGGSWYDKRERSHRRNTRVQGA